MLPDAYVPPTRTTSLRATNNEYARRTPTVPSAPIRVTPVSASVAIIVAG